MCGSRKFRNPHVIIRELRKLNSATDTIVHGAAPGADSLIDMYAKDQGFTVRPHKANWEAFGNGAGVIRNTAMLDIEAPVDKVIAFVQEPTRSPGTANMVLQALCRGIAVEVYTRD